MPLECHTLLLFPYPMRCVAVVDLCAGQVVHAVRGQRDRYGPVSSVLAASAAPEVVVGALRERLGIDAFYVADLDAIQQRGSARTVIEALVAAHADCAWWIDAGFGTPNRLEDYLAAPGVCAVIGSESLAEADAFASVRAALPRPAEAILSLDHRAGRFIGPTALWQDASCWPPTVIAMNLDRVGAAAGPDLALIAALASRAEKVVAAGGVRDARDLEVLREAGVSAVLLATALHDGRIRREDLAPCRN